MYNVVKHTQAEVAKSVPVRGLVFDETNLARLKQAELTVKKLSIRLGGYDAHHTNGRYLLKPIAQGIR